MNLRSTAGLVCLGLVLSACGSGLTLPGLSEPTEPPPTVTPTVVPTLTPLPTRTPKPAVTPSVEATRRGPARPNAGQVLDAENILKAQPIRLKLPATPMGIYWPSASRLALTEEGWIRDVDLVPLGLGEAEAVDSRGILAIAPNGIQVLVQRGDGGLAAWNRLDETRAPVKFAAAYFGVYAADGKTIALGAVEKLEVTLVDAATLKPMKTLSGFQTAAPIYSALPGPNGKTLAWYSRAHIQLQDVASGQMRQLLSFEDFVTSLAFSPDDKWLLVGVGGLLQAVDISKPAGAQAVDLSHGEVQPLSVVFSPDGSLAAAGMGNNVAVWQTVDWKQVGLLQEHSSQVRLISFSPDGKALVSIDEQNNLISWIVP